MTGRKLLIVENCQDCDKGTYVFVGKGEPRPYCKRKKDFIGEPNERLSEKDTHPDCPLEDARGFL